MTTRFTCAMRLPRSDESANSSLARIRWEYFGLRLGMRRWRISLFVISLLHFVSKRKDLQTKRQPLLEILMTGKCLIEGRASQGRACFHYHEHPHITDFIESAPQWSCADQSRHQSAHTETPLFARTLIRWITGEIPKIKDHVYEKKFQDMSQRKMSEVTSRQIKSQVGWITATNQIFKRHLSLVPLLTHIWFLQVKPEKEVEKIAKELSDLVNYIQAERSSQMKIDGSDSE